MTEEYEEDELVTSHSDENPELSTSSNNKSPGPLAVAIDDGTAVSELYNRDRKEKRLGVRDNENVIYYDEYIPPID